MNKSWFFKKAFHFSQIELVLDKILQELKKLHGTNPQAARNLPAYTIVKPITDISVDFTFFKPTSVHSPVKS